MDGLSQSALEDQAFDAAAVRYPMIPDTRIRSEILLWCGTHKWDYPDPERQLEALWDSLRGTLELAKAELIGYRVEDLAFYSLPHLRELVTQVCEGINSEKLDWAYLDCERALFKLLDAGNRAVIIGVHAGWLEDSDSYEEALRALQETLGGIRPRGLR